MSKAPLSSSLNHSLQVSVTPRARGPDLGTSKKSRMSSAKDLPLPNQPLALWMCPSVAAPGTPPSRGLPARAGEQKLLALFTLTFCLVSPLFSITPR